MTWPRDAPIRPDATTLATRPLIRLTAAASSVPHRGGAEGYSMSSAATVPDRRRQWWLDARLAAIYDALTDQDRLSLKEAFDKRKSRMPPEYEDYHLEKKDFLLTGDFRAWVGSRT